MDVSLSFLLTSSATPLNIFQSRVNAALTILQRAGYIDYEQNPDTKARVRFLLNRDDLYRLDSLTDKENDVTALLVTMAVYFLTVDILMKAILHKKLDSTETKPIWYWLI